MKRLLMLALLPAISFRVSLDAEVQFTRLYNQGGSDVYVATHASKLGVDKNETMDVTITAEKILDQGRAQVHLHWSDLHVASADDKTVLPPDLTTNTGANNLPVDFAPAKNTVDFMCPMLFLASSTSDQTTKLNGEFPIDWKAGPLRVKGTNKVIAINAGMKTFTSLIRMKLSLNAHDLGAVFFISTYELAGCRMLKSTGTFDYAGVKHVYSFLLKQ